VKSSVFFIFIPVLFIAIYESNLWNQTCFKLKLRESKYEMLDSWCFVFVCFLDHWSHNTFNLFLVTKFLDVSFFFFWNVDITWTSIFTLIKFNLTYSVVWIIYLVLSKPNNKHNNCSPLSYPFHFHKNHLKYPIRKKVISKILRHAPKNPEDCMIL